MEEAEDIVKVGTLQNTIEAVLDDLGENDNKVLNG